MQQAGPGRVGLRYRVKAQNKNIVVHIRLHYDCLYRGPGRHLGAAVLLEDAGAAGEGGGEVGAEGGGVGVGAGVGQARAQLADLGQRVLGPELLPRAGGRALGPW